MDTSAGPPILVADDTGMVGAELVRLLVAAGHSVRVMVRRSPQAVSVQAAGAEPVLADFDDPGSLAVAMAGVQRLLLLTAPNPYQRRLERAALDTAVVAGVRRVVRVSAADSNVRSDVPRARTHAFADKYLAETGLSWTVLRPTAIMQNLVGTAAVIRRGVLLLQTTGGGAESWIDARDVAAVAAHVLTTDGHDGATYFITGPHALTGRQLAEAIGAALGRRVRCVGLPRGICALLRFAGVVDHHTVRCLPEQVADVVRTANNVDTTHEVERLTGQSARTLHDFLRDHDHVFR